MPLLSACRATTRQSLRLRLSSVHRASKTRSAAPTQVKYSIPVASIDRVEIGLDTRRFDITHADAGVALRLSLDVVFMAHARFGCADGTLAAVTACLPELPTR
jgi:hypothetical protein